MPWHISNDHAGCDGWAVVKNSDDTIVGCHPTEAEAKKHMAALYANVPDAGRSCERTFVLEDIAIRAGGDGRTVVAYAAVFNTPAEITDQDGHYLEIIGPGAFDKTLHDRSGQIQVFFNHARTIYGTPSERFSMPLGFPEEIRPDERGLFTVTRYNRTPLADEVLESIRNGDVRGQSFSGRFMPGTSKRARGQPLDTITRSEVALREYGPTPMPSYQGAAIVGVRMEELVDTLRGLTQDERMKFFELLDTSPERPSPVDEAVSDTSSTNGTPAIHVPGPTITERRLRVAAFRKEFLR